VIPAGGLGTRFLPISRTVPKELLPIIDTPVIELVVAEMAAAGITRVVIVNAPGKESLDAYFRPNERLERRLESEFRKDEIELLKRPERLATVRVVIQVPQDCVDRHGLSITSLWNYNTISAGGPSNRSGASPTPMPPSE